MRKVFLFLGLLAIPRASWPQSDARPEFLVLGTYHMANPGHDVHNMQADDVLSPKRQQEIAQLIEVLNRFHPTRIAVEADVTSGRVGREYSDYLAAVGNRAKIEPALIALKLGTIEHRDTDGNLILEEKK